MSSDRFFIGWGTVSVFTDGIFQEHPILFCRSTGRLFLFTVAIGTDTRAVSTPMYRRAALGSGNRSSRATLHVTAVCKENCEPWAGRSLSSGSARREIPIVSDRRSLHACDSSQFPVRLCLANCSGRHRKPAGISAALVRRSARDETGFRAHDATTSETCRILMATETPIHLLWSSRCRTSSLTVEARQ